VTALGLSLDAWVYHPQLDDVTDLARAFPNTSIVMCPVGGPLGYGPYAGKRDEVFATWNAKITELVTCQNVAVKLGGMIKRLAAFDNPGFGVPSRVTGNICHRSPADIGRSHIRLLHWPARRPERRSPLTCPSG
jgi:hypothetical protein